MEENRSNRVIGRYSGKERGPLLICFGGIHGNELSGIRAIELMLKMLEVEPITNTSFNYRGRFIGIRGNLQAIDKGVRFIDGDLNRMWIKDDVHRVANTSPDKLQNEELEMYEIYHTVNQEIENYQPTSVVFLDLHTTTASGGIFTIPYEDPKSIGLAKELYAPVILGMLEGIHGTIMHFFNKKNFPKYLTTSLCFESGQHKDPLSVNRAIAAMTNCMRAIGSVRKQDVAHRHNSLLQSYSQNLPAILNLIKKHTIYQGDGFRMHPGYRNFQKVTAGELIASDKSGEIKCPRDCMILMPLYQRQGEDGFFLVEEGF